MATPKLIEEKIYTPETIPDTPFPNQDTAGSSAVLQQVDSTNQIYSPKTIAETPFTQPVIANETISSNFNTQTKKILNEFTFAPMGAIRIGNYQDGDTGDISISPDGILARDKYGNPTFSLNGDTGDATFKGVVQASGFNIIDDQGLISLNNFDNNVIFGTPLQYINTNNSTVDINGASGSLNLQRSCGVLLILTILCSQYQVGGGDCSGSVVIITLFDNVSIYPYIRIDSTLSTDTGARENIITKTYTSALLQGFPPGDHILKLQAGIYNNNNMQTLIEEFSLSYIKFGN